MIGFPKPRPRLLEKRTAAAKLAERDRHERNLCHVRSGGRCECREVVGRVILRCTRQATENHHLRFGLGIRNRGVSIEASYRLDCCTRCHQEITHHVLVPVTTKEKSECAATVRYERRS